MTELAVRLFQKASRSKLMLILPLNATKVVSRLVPMVIPLVNAAPVVAERGSRI